MDGQIEIIGLGGVNCYLIRESGSYYLIDAGFASRRSTLVRRLENAGCRLGNFKLVILTHGDLDHAGNAAFLREKYGPSIAIHREDAAMVETGNIFINRKARLDRSPISFKIIRLMDPVLFPKPFETFKPDILLEDRQDLSGFGISARIIGLPGHSKGSIGVLTAEGDLFCGDLLANVMGKPHLPMMEDMAATRASIDKLKKLKVRTVYPGHGKPFPLDAVHIR